MSNFLNTFYSSEYEKNINKKMLYYNYEFPIDDVREYVNSVNNISIDKLLEYVLDSCNDNKILPRDVIQFSNFEDATVRVCEVIKDAGDPGLNFFEMGGMLLNDNKQRNASALIKYGENHAKTAEALSLLYELSHKYFLTCLGYVSNDLPIDEWERLLLRLTLRNKLVRQIYRASQYGDVDIRQLLIILSDSTYNRRKSNIKRILNVLNESEEYDFNVFIDRIKL